MSKYQENMLLFGKFTQLEKNYMTITNFTCEVTL